MKIFFNYPFLSRQTSIDLKSNKKFVIDVKEISFDELVEKSKTEEEILAHENLIDLVYRIFGRRATSYIYSKFNSGGFSRTVPVEQYLNIDRW